MKSPGQALPAESSHHDRTSRGWMSVGAQPLLLLMGVSMSEEADQEGAPEPGPETEANGWLGLTLEAASRDSVLEVEGCR